MGKPITALISDIEEHERRQAAEPEPMTDIYMVGVPMPMYKALSDAAAKRNMTFAQLLSHALTSALEE